MTDNEFPGTLPAMLSDIPAERYHAGPGVSRSDLVAFSVTPLHYKHQKGKPYKPTDAMELGRRTHMAVLEPDRFAESVVFEPDFGDCRYKENKASRDAWRAEHEGRDIVSAKQHAQIVGMQAAIMEHPAARALLMGADCKREVSLYWKDLETGLMCRCRPDVLRFDGIIPDLKTCSDASPKEAARACWDFGYDLEATHYTAGLHAVSGVEPRPFPFVFVESEPPHAIAVYVLEADALEYAEKRRRKLLRAFAECVASGKWPGYPETIQSLALPAWAMKQAANDNKGDA